MAIIVPETGNVEGWVDFHGLLNPEPCRRPVDVLNGIAYDDHGGHLFGSGGLRSQLFEIRLLK